MNHLARQTAVRLGVFLSCIGFVLQGAFFLPLIGIQTDEALIANPIFGSIANQFRIRLFHHNIPLMLMDYVGALKSWLYWPIFAIFRPSPESLRWPVLILGAVTIWLFYLLLNRIAGARAALAGCALLATDTMFLLTTEIDWGPVALQHLLLVTACLLLLRGSLFFGFLALGLGLWDKASFGWMLGGLAFAGVIVFPREISRRLDRRNIAVALAGFLLGASPLIVFNARNHWPTHAAFSMENVTQKATVLKSTLDGFGLFGYMAVGSEHRNILLPALVIAAATAPFCRKSRRAILFGLVFMIAAWILMAFTANAGGSVHHAVLLWPFPQFVIALALAEASQRLGRKGLIAFVALISILCSANLRLTYQYHASLVRNGPMLTFTDAIYPLSDSLFGETHEVIVMDWGIYDPLLLLNRGQINLDAGFFEILNGRADEKIEALLKKDAVFVTHSPENQFFPAANQKLEAAAAALRYRKELLRTVPDSHGRTVFRIYRFVR
ncbi:MAG TPA: glycosyltransferase family 39 protein [Bryobacteraceae bacterium]|nr:glycosyltransferase family 39 protein [Bryobacteraceae bacterium]